MGLKCSVLGHRFGDPDVEREREERGSEVVTTTREVAVCERCEEKRVLSENKEVTAVIDESEIDGGSGTDADEPSGPGDRSGGEPDHEPGSGPEPEPDGDDLVSEAVKNVRGERDAPGGMADIDVPEEDEGAEIMSDDADGTRERGYGEWPAEPGEEPEPWDPDATDDADTGTAESTGVDPDDVDEQRDDARAGDEAASTDQRPFGTGSAEDVAPDTGAEIIDGGPGSAGDQSDATGDHGHVDPAPVDADAPRTDAGTEGTGDAGAAGREDDGSEIIDAEDHQPDEPPSGASPASSPGVEEAGSSGGSGGTSSGADDDPIDAEAAGESGESDEGGAGAEPSFEETAAASPSRPDAYECPECGFETTATNSPLRAGDPCPECSAYLVGSERKT